MTTKRGPVDGMMPFPLHLWRTCGRMWNPKERVSNEHDMDQGSPPHPPFNPGEAKGWHSVTLVLPGEAKGWHSVTLVFLPRLHPAFISRCQWCTSTATQSFPSSCTRSYLFLFCRYVNQSTMICFYAIYTVYYTGATGKTLDSVPASQLCDREKG